MKFLSSIAVILCIAGVQVSAQVPAARAVRTEENSPKYIRSYLEILDKGDVLGTSSWGVVAMRADGDTIVSFNGRRRLVPASNVKLLTTGLAMNELGADFRFRTSLAYSGRIEGGTLKGDLYIVGGGDPTLGSKDSIAVATDALFASWKAILDKAGISRIEGRVIGDGRYFDGPIERTHGHIRI
ncbi:MAG: D-alanyl-D-alanine carboxypeptidase [Bacteroidales bacterium]|nr:D-alanyl-D-alanine carboxypeptidase [Bacteroidales bacterium]